MLGSNFNCLLELSFTCSVDFNFFSSDVVCLYDFFFKGEVNKCQGLQIDKDGKPVRNPEVSKGQDIYKYIEQFV